ncbi:RNA 2',3'-cyclic phosphodiesterase [Naumannella cuiyingiana]|uniref:RNA 2',3'-cyclic phosphodiesterase n=1 Tax=Naumannella cuiyingiana TaxID=1347891 RepID=A0A7Z0D5W2_9ACTN|nr:RNA 2',3'-cyclic phosphodiesterase [Naumannella cuiyingiana]NYI69467.1 2'-5' RNA ligase [Naumannella cuiyingiana]
MSHRMFVAALPPEDVIDDLDAFVEPRRGADPRLRWTPAEQWHLTTAFLPRVPDRAVEPLIAELTAATSVVPPFAAALTGAGCFGPPDAARVLWLGLAPGADELARLSRRTRSAANRVGAEPDGSNFTAHLTLARANRRFEAGRWLQILDTHRSRQWTVDELWLIASHLGEGPRGRARHERLAALPLARSTS